MSDQYALSTAVNAVLTCFRGSPHGPPILPALNFVRPLEDDVGASFRSWAFPNRMLRSWCVCSRFWSVFLHLGALHGRFWSGQGRSGEGFGGSNGLFFPCFFMLSRARALAVRKSSRCAKTSVFPGFSSVLSTLHMVRARQKTTQYRS